jgi:hypothetical protein
MTYEYEHDVISELEQMGVDYQSNGYFNMSIEVQEVYRKAKAWDNYIAEVRERVRFTENTEGDIENETQKVIDYYLEDE